MRGVEASRLTYFIKMGGGHEYINVAFRYADR